MITRWIDRRLLRDFQAEGTDAHRLCTIEDGWVERFGSDVLISFKRVFARERLLEELQTWADSVGFAVRRGDTFPGLGEEWLRLAVRDRATVNRFLQALDQAVTLSKG